MIALVTDSNSQIPPSLVERYGITVVPLPVTIDGVDYLEGIDIDADDFYRRFESGAPQVATAQPSPGQFAAAYDLLVAHGAEAILSVHIGSVVSGTINSARLAAAGGSLAVPVRIVDTGAASFAITLCAWAAAEALAAGADIEDAAVAAEETAATVGNVFVVRALEHARRGGRLAPGERAVDPAAIPVLSMDGGAMRVVGQANDLAEVADLMASYVRGAGRDLRVGIGVADAAVTPMWEALEERLVGTPEVREVVRYRVGPSVGVHTGPGTVGAMYAPAR